MPFLILIFIPIIVYTISFFLPMKYKLISWKEFLIMMTASIIIALISTAIIFYQNITYTEVWNGLVTGKLREKVSCEHSYPCNCHLVCSGSGKNESCYTHCDTCYDHDYDWSYRVYDNVNQTFTIDRIDRQGVGLPPRWIAVQNGEPTSSSHWYKDYIKGSQGNLFKKDVEYKNFKVPEYPGKIYDYYRLNRIIVSDRITIKDLNKYQYLLSEVNGRLGPMKQCNIILLIVKNQDPKYFYAVQQKWQGGSKNDIVVIISVNGVENNIEWANAICLSESDLFRVKLRDSIQELKTLDMDKVLSSIETTTRTYYTRKSMKKFSYLAARVQPTTTQLIIALIFNILACVGLTVWFYKDTTLDQ